MAARKDEAADALINDDDTVVQARVDVIADRLLQLTGRPGYRFVPLPIRAALSVVFSWIYMRSSLEHARAHPLGDPLYNVVLPQGEEVRIPAIWVVEMYPPSYASRMARNIERAGWRETWPTFERDVQDRVARARTTGTIGSTTLARIVNGRPGGPGIDRSLSMKLPQGYKAVEIQMVELQNSLTAIVAKFDLTDDESLSLDRVLRQTPEPEVRSRGRHRHQIFDRAAVSERRAFQERVRLRANAREWLSSRVPGVFAEEGDGKLPVLDLLVLSDSGPGDEEDIRKTNYYRAIGIEPSFYRTTSKELAGLSLQERPSRFSRDDGDSDAFSLVGRRSAILNDRSDKKSYGPSDLQYISNRLGDPVARYLSRIGITCLLDLKARQSAHARDRAYALHARRTVRSIRALRESLLRGSLDTLAIADGIEKLTANISRYRWMVPEFETARIRPQKVAKGEKAEAPTNQLEYLAKSQGEEAKRLIQEDESTRQILGVVASLTASVEGIRAQRWGFAISLLSLVVAGLAVIVTVGWSNFWKLASTEVSAWLNGILSLIGFAGGG